MRLFPRVTLLIFFLTHSLLTVAATQGSAAVPGATQSVAEEEEESSRFSFEGSLETSSTFHPLDDVNRDSGTTLVLNPGWKVTPEWTVSGLVWLTQSWVKEQTFTVDRSELGLRHAGLSLGRGAKFSPGFGAILPLTYDARGRKSLYFGMRVAPRLILDLATIGVKGLQVMGEVSGTRNFHEYTTTTEGNSNIEYNLANRLNVGYEFVRNLTFTTDFIYSSGWTYSANIVNKFILQEELSYQLTSALGIAVGLANEGSALKPNGLDSNVAFYDENSATFYGSVTVTY